MSHFCWTHPQLRAICAYWTRGHDDGVPGEAHQAVVGGTKQRIPFGA